MEGVYIHCGSDVFKPELIVKKFDRWDKPSGLWASPEDSDWGWREWCEAEDFRGKEELSKSFRFKLKSGARVLQIRHLRDVEPFAILNPDFIFLNSRELDLNRIYSEFDAMEVHMSENWCELHDSHLFYSWDVDSIAVWNPDVIEVINS